MSQKLQRLGNPIFLFSLVLLILNDWVFKYSFHNLLTGKLSDFSGLFAFPFFVSTLFPKQIKSIHISTFVLFIIWKSELSQPFIDLVNYKTELINRVIDYSDYIALVSISISYCTFIQHKIIEFKPLVGKITLVVSCAAFLATSIPKHIYNANKKCDFNFSKKELVQRFNKVQKDDLSFFKDVKDIIVFDSSRNAFYFKNLKDTVLKLVDYNKLSDRDTIYIRSSNAWVQLLGNDSISSLKLVNINTSFRKRRIDKAEKSAVNTFEKIIIEKIKSAKNF
jgi:hypothetical protein